MTLHFPPMKVITCVVHPIFIELQWQTIRRFMPPGSQLVVFNDAVDFPDYTNGYTPDCRAAVEAECRRLNIPCFNLLHGGGPAYDWTDPCFRCAYAMNRVLEWQRARPPDEYLLLDSDMILVAPFDMAAWRRGFAAVVLQTRPPDVVYFWNGLAYMNFAKMPQSELLNWDFCPGCDVGGRMQGWLQAVGVDNPGLWPIPHLQSGGWDALPGPELAAPYPSFLIDFLQQDPRNTGGPGSPAQFFCELYEGAFLHFRAGSGWMGDGGPGLNMQKTLAAKMSAVLDAAAAAANP